MRPIGYTRDVSVLHRIEMNVIDMAIQIRIIANRVFPMAALPDPLLSLDNFARGIAILTRCLVKIRS